ncbi:MAG: hypothetical protein LBD10_14110 [Desulfobulbus sp.]|jgi:hypothetical protein|uniref:hypothetical protein n=1 Tax=Desulfobulbus sp. TaxID=895 RepID=UPI0028490F48|nr:hypothetical protein [Desulfobulbus sp.]MDR2551325.1 hypothetical protein [Desulfobulbus sp.]
MTPDDVLGLFARLEELRAIGYWVATLLAINAGLLAANIVASTVQIRLGRS